MRKIEVVVYGELNLSPKYEVKGKIYKKNDLAANYRTNKLIVQEERINEIKEIANELGYTIIPALKN